MISCFDENDTTRGQVRVEDGVTAAAAGSVASREVALQFGSTVGAKIGFPVPLEQRPGLVDASVALQGVHSEHCDTHIREEVILRGEKRILLGN